VTLASVSVPKMGRALLLGCAALLTLALPASGQRGVLTGAHAHNDYEHPRPLLDALDQGFNSVEADVYLVDGELYVAHEREEIRPERTLERLYLAPLRARIQRNGGQVYPGAPPLLLLIDLKTDSTATYARLNQLLRGYADIFTIFAHDSVAEGPVIAIVSGARPEAAMRAAPLRFAAFDGRLPDLARVAPLPPTFMPLVSESWSKISDWDGTGAVPPHLSHELARLTDLAHQQGRRIRFWGSPDTQAAWALLRDAGVDLINTDDLAGLRAFLLRERSAAIRNQAPAQ
jgi:hypothetical protein